MFRNVSYKERKSMVYLKTFKLNEYRSRSRNRNLYPFNVLKGKEPDVFVFEPITVLYGNNGSGKSTILNLIAHMLDVKGKEKNVKYFYKFFKQRQKEFEM